MINIFHRLDSNLFDVVIGTKEGLETKTCADIRSAFNVVLICYKPDLITLHISDDGMKAFAYHVCTIYYADDLWNMREEIPPTKARVFVSMEFSDCIHEAYACGCNLIFVETKGFYETL